MKVIARSSNLLGKITILVMVGLCVNTALALDGSGTEENPWRIKSLEDFNDFAADANYWDDYTRLETDVNLAGITYSTAVIAPYYNPFTGIFDGNDHKIFHLTIYGGVGNDYLGLFGKIYQGEVINLGLEGGSVNAIHPYSHSIGGLVGMNDGSIFNCYSTGDANGYGDIGGLVGGNNGTISDCYSTGNVNGTDKVGGLIGHNNGSISKSYTTVDVGGVDGIGGLVGINANGSLLNCYSTGNVNGYKFVGGLAGDNFHYGSISNCYSISDVNGTDKVGGLLGHNFIDSWVSNCFWDTDTQTHGVTKSIGENYHGTVTNVHGLPTSQLHQQSTFTGWDFINVWNIGENQTYPYLRVYLAGDINKDGIVNFLDVAITANQWMEGVE